MPDQSPTSVESHASGGFACEGVQPLSIVVPCYNEAESLVRLEAELERLKAALAEKFDVELVLVDDGSTDETWRLLDDIFGGLRGVKLMRHAINRGIAAAIGTGLAAARAEIVASLDADCTYDPLELVPLLALMADDVDMAVASPYHPQGRVDGVSAWRLALSRLASRLYRGVMRNRLYTYTSCVRVYRKSSVIGLAPSQGGFVGVVELLWLLDRRGGKIVESPAVLRVRTTGQSKMRVVRTAVAHLRLLARAAWEQLAIRPPVQARSSPQFAPRTT